ncbi:SusC/RagA family TonB-linked outer membrane protein [Aestuariibaculum suncheonense]|uniref:SusC/RagA family TonB-linked outer membrane protein n=1 Tax=Aestuariibaculum suncheonense TaxID=1028745 RepID=A0A8J6Q982_9FLAO|nr:SusC/RagA family TonB-linked outer membrane protein [Aestuariibaculum suncheonense]MBD0835555.1 SusC/RagA family TonB-linked outer membrane protein [Aestuariibaculum suncheonense]
MNQKLFKLLFVFCFFGVLYAGAQTTVSGVVSDVNSGIPLPGANVVVKGTSKGVATDFDGRYVIEISGDEILVFSSIGYTTKEISVAGQTTINVQLTESTESLEEVVVTSFGITKEKRAIGYATSTVEAEELTKTGTPNFATALYGKAPGVQIAATTGGSTSGVNMQIRGIGSIFGNTQPLFVVDGVPIRNGENDNSSYWSDQRIQGNGILDINPEDIENISILKGASAAATYGNEALNGVVLITTKSGKGMKKGLGVSVNSTYTVDQAAYFPRFQNVRGPGYPTYFNDAGQDEDGWLYRDGQRTPIATNVNFGPKFDGQPTLAWTGEVIPYRAQKGVEGLYQDAHNFINNIAIVNATDKSNMRFSYTRQDNEGLSRNAENDKNIFNLNASFNWNDDLKTDVLVNYINAKVLNRPYKIDRLTNNFGGMMTRFDSGEWYFDRAQTSLGYRFVTGDNPSLTPDENLRIPGYRGDVLDYAWRVNNYQFEENSDRVIASLTQHWNITDELTLRGRMSTDFTAFNMEDKRPSVRPLSLGGPGGSLYRVQNRIDKLVYGDLFLTYNKDLTEDLGMTLMAGYSGTKSMSTMTQSQTNGGLSVENWFSLNASANTPTAAADKLAYTKDAFIGTANFSYKNYLFLEGTIRRDRTSTMNPNDNAFFYPSVNSGFVFSDAFEMPDFINYGKLRASWGKVGNFPPAYQANIAYQQNPLGDQGNGTVIYTSLPLNQGNEAIKSETQRDVEFGLEFKMFTGRINLDMTYYDSRLEDQIIPLTLPNSTGATSVLTNIGTMRNKGFELAINTTPIAGKDFTWDSGVNFAFNRNTVESLAPGLDEFVHANYDGSAAKLVSQPGEPAGVFYTHPVATDANGNKIVDPNGLYKVDADEWIKVGSAQPKVVGGFTNFFSYKNFSLSALIDFRVGGYVMPTALNWMISRGLTEESLKYMDAEHGGLSWYENAAGDRFLVDQGTASGPNGERVYDNGIVLDGVKADGTENDYITSNPEYYNTVYNWGGPQYSPNTRYELYIKENTYFKMRELSLAYQLPSTIVKKIGFQELQLSAFGRNLFYFYRNIKDMDAEQLTAGSRWFQNVNTAGMNPSSRTFGLSLRAKL